MAQVSDRYGDPAKTGTARFEHAMRPDTVGPCLTGEAALSNAPETDGKFFKVPKVIER
jgi:aspartyl-tRNA(Asn)/glutamyl-tRNA(Gln) amidotransferase subunit C